MKTLTTGQQDAVEAAAQVEYGMILFDFVSGLYGFWDGPDPITWNSITFVPGAQLIQVEFGGQGLDLASQPVTLRLAANADAGLSPNILASIESETYHQRPVTIYEVIFDPDTRTMIGDPLAMWRGYVDQVTHEIGADDGTYHLVGRCESRSIDYTRRGWALQSDAQQQQIFTGDLGLQYTGIAGTVQIDFGRASSTKSFVPKPGPVL